MTSERWQKVKDLFAAAANREPRERNAFLNEACGNDEDLKREVELLLDQNSETGILEGAIAEVLSDATIMQLAAGTRLGQYRVEEHLGMGGMGTVYKATDTTLGREVALKMLHPEMLDDPAGVARLEREARTLASLNHPHIGVIYSFETHDTVRFLALEYVPGPTLADRLRRRGLPLREAMQIAQQIAEALEAAHAKSIIHRDLKPANIKVSESGQVKVLDFGLAKRVEQAQPSLSGDITMLTEKLAGRVAVAGTPAYMSPEQASGTKVDFSTDIWAFGCVLYEMLTGKKAFSGTTVTEILAAVLEREPEWTALPEATPTPLQYLIRRCLRKDPNSRLRDIGDARIELEDCLAGSEQDNAPREPASMTRRQAISALVGAAAGAASTGIVAISRYRGDMPRNLTRFALMLPEGSVAEASFNRRLGISPDGRLVAYGITVAGQGQNAVEAKFYLHSLSELEPKLLTVGGSAPFFSPDGQWLGFTGFGAGTYQLRKVGLGGGAPVTICPATLVGGATWADGDTIYFVANIPGGVSSVSASSGQPKQAAPIEFAQGERIHKCPCALPGGKAVLFTVATVDSESFDDAHIAAFSTQTGNRKTLVEGGTQALYSPSGHLVYARNGSLLAVRFDPDRLQVTGQPFTVLQGVLMSRNTGTAQFDISRSGDLVYMPGKAEGGARTVLWVNRNGEAENLPLPPRSYLHPRISPDARKLAIEIEGSNHDIYVYDFASSVLSKITTDGVSHWPIWSPDGKEIGYRLGPMGAWKLWRIPADRSHPPEQVPATGFSQSPESYSPDGHTIVYTAAAPGAPGRITVVPLQGDRTPRPLDNTKYAQGSPKFSPDGRWVAYCSNESGNPNPQVYIQAFPGPGPKIQVSTDGGTDPVWRRTGGELFYRSDDSMMAVPVSTTPTLAAGRPRELWKGHYSHGMSSSCGPPGTTSSNYDVTADGNRFLMIKDDDQDRAISKQIVVVLGWADELRRIDGKA